MGRVLTDNGRYVREIRSRIRIAKELYLNINWEILTYCKMKRSVEISLNINLTLWQCVVDNFVTYEEETWAKIDVDLQKDTEKTTDETQEVLKEMEIKCTIILRI